MYANTNPQVRCTYHNTTHKFTQIPTEKQKQYYSVSLVHKGHSNKRTSIREEVHVRNAMIKQLPVLRGVGCISLTGEQDT